MSDCNALELPRLSSTVAGVEWRYVTLSLATLTWQRYRAARRTGQPGSSSSSSAHRPLGQSRAPPDHGPITRSLSSASVGTRRYACRWSALVRRSSPPFMLHLYCTRPRTRQIDIADRVGIPDGRIRGRRSRRRSLLMTAATWLHGSMSRGIPRRHKQQSSASQAEERIENRANAPSSLPADLFKWASRGSEDHIPSEAISPTVAPSTTVFDMDW